MIVGLSLGENGVTVAMMRIVYYSEPRKWSKGGGKGEGGLGF